MTLATQPILLIINISLFSSIYDYNGVDTLKGYSFEQMVWYFTSVMIVQSFVWNSVSNQISRKIITGDLSLDLIRPISIFQVLMARSLASRFVAIIMDFIPGLILYSLILTPYFLTYRSFVMFLIVVIPAFFLNFILAYFIGITAVLTQNNSSIVAVINLIAAFVGGAFIPLEFFSSSVNRVLDFLPFKYIIYWPIQFFLNNQPDKSWGFLFEIIFYQVVWIVVLYALFFVVWKRILKNYGAAGG